MGVEGNELELSIVGYRFPRSERDPWDSNSLLVSVRVVSPQGTWEVVDPCLTTWEAEHVVRWLAAVARSVGWAPATLSEPNLTLTAGSGPRGRGLRLRARFELELRPPWVGATGAGGLSVDLDVDRAQLAEAADSLAADLDRFPQRGDRPDL